MGDQRSAQPLLLLLLSLMLLARLSQLWAFPFSPSLDLDVTPRTTVFSKGLLGSACFTGSSQNYSTLLLEEDAGLLYVGGRGALYALNTSNISTPANLIIDWDASPEQKKQCLNKGRDNQTECYNHIRFLQRYNETHLYVCGTNAFRPLCAYIDAERFSFSSGLEDGRDRCPYDPAKGYTGLLVDGEMFTATQYEFRSSPDVRRNFPFPTLRTEEAPTRWLLEADFVGSVLLKESINSSTGDDDKIYFFFTERSQEQIAYPSQTKVSRVARVCKTDWGGQRTLQRKWTSFLKARMVCSVPEYELHLNILRSVFVLQGRDAQSSIFYGIFGLEWKNIKASAICQYAFSDVQKAFEGPYMEVQDSKWREYTGKVPEPRPGSCITDLHRSQGINSSRDLPDNVLTFARRHPLMASQVHPIGVRPLMFKRSVNYVKIVVHKEPALDGNIYTILFLGTDDGWLHRAVDIDGEMHIIEELQLFYKPQPIESMVISSALRSIYVGSHSGVVQVPMSSCQRYTSCYDCVFARDPFCGWDGNVCVDISSHANRSNLTQDILRGIRGCKENSGNVVHRRRSVMSGDDVLLQCELRSNLAAPRWTLNGKELQGYGLNSGYRIGTDGLLIIGARAQQSGSYRCFAVENSVSVLVYLYTVKVHTDSYFPVEPTATTNPTTVSSLTVFSTSNPTEQPLPSPPAPQPPGPEFQTYRHMEAVYISLVAVLGGLCLVLTVVLLYVSFCTRRAPHNRKFSQQGLQVLGESQRKRSSHFELKTISSHCNGRQGRRSISVPTFGDIGDGFLQIVPGEGSPSKTPPPAPPLPMPPPLPNMDYANGLSATLPSVLRKMNGNSYVLLRQADPEGMSPLYHSFTEELNRILEKRKHTQLDLMQPDESSI
ncbi:semaphorin-4G [Micropterus salmoides]|uniref:semaphorin-4G n=1 Tax=Micropterus salmoides TaxID=27706 RepID=UPI0018EB382A|nr:semaphorin-4G [Micropterus salmoides]XP_038590968.1 semaphorin-4G [Micropterus salmoides]XP_038590969.1 semaphorin-4G [Micropterus salmoides]